MNNRKTNINNMFIILTMSLIFIATISVLPLITIVYAVNQVSNSQATVTVPSTCTVSLSPTTFSFGASLAPGTTVVTNSPAGGVVDTDQGNLGSTAIFVSGTNWVLSSTVNFFVTNTIWNPTNNLGSQIGNQLTLTAVNTFLLIAAAGGTNTLFFGVNVPNGQAAGTYTSNIILTNVC